MYMEKKSVKAPVYEREKDVLYIRLPREFDHFSARNMKVETEALIEAAGIRNIVFDFTNTEFMDSTGIGVLLGRYKRMKFAGGAVYTWHVGLRIRRMLEVAGVTRLITELE
ncbi:MAG: anti-sigma factor antagonist [Lachnospiraceae bacterium]|nr:anti-sigma factor antagonist [Lachnospiraceae bacterium]